MYNYPTISVTISFANVSDVFLSNFILIVSLLYQLTVGRILINAIEGYRTRINKCVIGPFLIAIAHGKNMDLSHL